MAASMLLLILVPLLDRALAACVCRSKAQCTGQFATMSDMSATVCPLPGGGEGFCCDAVLASSSTIGVRFAPKRSRQGLNLPQQAVDREDIKRSLARKRQQQLRDSQVDGETKGHNQFTKPRAEDKDLEDASRSLFHLMNDIGISVRSANEGFDSENTVEVDDMCPWTNSRRPECPSGARYRSVNGGCNNPGNPLLGMSGTPFRRILASTYHKFGNTPRQAVDGDELPSARAVSQALFEIGDDRMQDVSALFMQVGQFLDHDITHTPNAGIGPVGTPQCCLEDQLGRDWVYPASANNGQPDVCFPIEVLPTDRFWRVQGRGCMHFSRSSTAPTVSPAVCEAGRWEQRNAVSHWMDNSNVYGSTETESEDVRDGQDRAFLAVTAGSSRERGLLPTCRLANVHDREPESCDIANCGSGCTFVGGDLRVNEMPALTVQHTAWMREHNRIAAELQKINPRWDGERVFQQARRILNAQWQHIIFSEWLPVLLGPAYMAAFDLQPLTSGYSEDYDPEFDPSINNEFATAAFRFAHTLITPNVPGRDANGRNTTFLDLRDVFNKGVFLEERGFIEDTIRGQSQEPVPALDSAFVDDVLDHLFESEEGQNGGLDLVALNIQRGRDHGIPGYNQYRDVCHSVLSRFNKADSFRDLTRGGWLSENNMRRLTSIYKHVDDIDLFAAGILEDKHKDGLVGPTFKCIIGDQFIRLKRGDRFWHEHGDDPRTRFTLPQLQELRKASLARVMCDNTDIERAQPLMFRTPGPGNRLVGCRDGSIPRLNLDVFREEL